MTKIYLADDHRIYCSTSCVPPGVSSRMRWLLESSGNEVVDALVNRAVCDGCKRLLVQERRSA